MNQSIKQVWNAATTVLISLLVVLALLLWGVQLVGMEVFVVQSGSMEPEYPTGSVVYVRKADAAELEVGDVITFNLGGGVRGTHRIIEVVEEDGVRSFRTKGDANDHPDNGLVTQAGIVGKVVFCIPMLGFLTAYIQSPPGTYVAMAVGAAVLLLTVLPEFIFDDKKSRE